MTALEFARKGDHVDVMAMLGGDKHAVDKVRDGEEGGRRDRAGGRVVGCAGDAVCGDACLVHVYASARAQCSDGGGEQRRDRRCEGAGADGVRREHA